MRPSRASGKLCTLQESDRSAKPIPPFIRHNFYSRAGHGAIVLDPHRLNENASCRAARLFGHIGRRLANRRSAAT